MSEHVIFCKNGDFSSAPMIDFDLSFSSSERLRSRCEEICLIRSDTLTYFRIPSHFIKENMVYSKVMEKYVLKKGVKLTFRDAERFICNVVSVEGEVDSSRGSFKLERNSSCNRAPCSL